MFAEIVFAIGVLGIFVAILNIIRIASKFSKNWLTY